MSAVLAAQKSLDCGVQVVGPARICRSAGTGIDLLQPGERPCANVVQSPHEGADQLILQLVQGGGAADE